MENSKIEWCDHTINLWWGCTEVHAGCDNCYANTLSKRWGFDLWGKHKLRRKIKSAFVALEQHQNDAKKKNELQTIFVGSMMDIFEKSLPLGDPNTGEVQGTTGELRDKLFGKISDGKYPNLIFLFLTKRPSNINKYIPHSWKSDPPTNVVFGTSVVTQKTCEDLIPKLLQVNGHRFLSVEPQLGKISLDKWLQTGGIDWVIQGGESGYKRRPFDTNWGKALRDECFATQTPYFFKQVDKIISIPDDLLVRQPLPLLRAAID